MPIKQITPMQDIEVYLKEQIRGREEALINTMAYAGEMVVNDARVNGSYRDRTGNLRSSVGYLIVKDGTIIRKGGFGGLSGGAEGEIFARKIAGDFPSGIVLIVVAGMNYAQYVAAKGYNVLDSSEALARKIIPQLIKQLGLSIK